MTIIRTFIKWHAVLTFYIVVFVISWGGFLMAVGATTSMAVVEIPPVAILSMVAGPIVASILLTSLVYGRAGWREFGARLFRWRVDARWYAMALLPAPLLMAPLPPMLASPVMMQIVTASLNRSAPIPIIGDRGWRAR